MPGKRTSPIWNIPADEFQELLDTSDSIVDVLRKVGLDPYNGNHKTINQRVKEEGFDTSKLKRNRKIASDAFMKSLGKKNTYSLDDVLVENSNYDNKSLKNRLVSEGLMKNKCFTCGNDGEWNGEKLVLQIDHINGVNNDNRLENLRLLCPNCHSQTETFCGRRLKMYGSCDDCGDRIHRKSKKCLKCSSKSNGVNQRRFEISKEDLKELISNYPMTTVGKMLGVSDNAVRKRCKTFGLL